MRWNLRYAAHLGFRSFEQPLFPFSAGSTAPIAQIDFVASLGLAGIQDPWFTTRPREVQDAIAERLAHHGLAAGGIVCGTPATVRTPLWTRNADALEEEVRIAIDAASRLGARQIVVLTGADVELARQDQLGKFITNLSKAAAHVAAHGLKLCLEPTNARTLPGMLMNHFDEACAIVRAVDNPALRMVFDTAHIQSMDGDLMGRLERNLDLIEIVQIANHPLRTEPEVGEINMAAVLRKVHGLGFNGLVELEHIWSRPGIGSERRALDWLATTDAGLAHDEGGDPA